MWKIVKIWLGWSSSKLHVAHRPATHLSWNTVRPWNMKKRKVYRVCLAHFTEHLFHISYFTSFRSRWRFLDEISRVSFRILCKSALIRSLKSKFPEDDKKCVKECFSFHFLLRETLWNRVCEFGQRVLCLWTKYGINTKRWRCKTDNTVIACARYDWVVFFYVFPWVFGWKFYNILHKNFTD